MADSIISNSETTLLETASHIPIAQLTPLLSAPSTRSIRAVVTLTWPYSSATGSVAFLLAEPDFRLRRTRGQVRVQFSGSSAKAVAKSGIASGDEVNLSLDGVGWVEDATPFATPGRGVEFELKFTERLLLQSRQEGSHETGLINIDHPTPELEAPPVERIASPETVPSPYASPYTISNLGRLSSRPSLGTNIGDEWSSPAFTKRARISYGSMFDREYDPFAEEDGSVRGKGRKRTRLSSTWKYQSRSPTPEAKEQNSENASPEPKRQAALIMTDEGCQTVGLDDGGAAEVLADSHNQGTNVGRSSYGSATLETQQLQQGVAEPQSNETLEDLPTIQTQPDMNAAKTLDQQVLSEKISQKMPSSPRLQPISSDALPLVSPLITSKYGGLFGMDPPQGVVGQIPSLTKQTASLVQEPPVANEEEQEDLYGASPAAAIHGQGHTNDLTAFQDPSIGFNALEEASNMQDQFLREDRYGHWQAANAQISPIGSPHPPVGEVEMEEAQHGYYAQEQVEIGFQKSNESHPHHYPDPDEASYGHSISHSWRQGPEAITYPDLPDLEEGREHFYVEQQALYSGPAAVSRSGSAHSNAIDLTEESDEGEAEEADQDEDALGDSVENEDYDRSNISQEGIEDEEGEQKFDPEQPPKPIRNDGYRSLDEESSERGEEEGSVKAQAIHGGHLNEYLLEDDAASQNSQDEEPYEEEMYEEESVEDDDQRYQQYTPHVLLDQGEDFDEDEDEGSYEEEMDDDGQTARPAHGEPVVIDLLSSDDESALEPDASQRPASEYQQSEPDEDMDVEQDLAISQDNFLRQPLEEGSEDEDETERLSVNEYEKMEDDEDGDDKNQLDTRDEARAVDEYIAEPAELRQNTDMASRDDTLEVTNGVLDHGSYNKETIKSKEDAETAQTDVPLVADELHGVPEKMEVVEAGPEDPEDPEESEEKLPGSTNTLQEVEMNQQLLGSAAKNDVTASLDIKVSSEITINHPPPPPSLFSRMFNLDGANDEPRSSSAPPDNPAMTATTKFATSELKSQAKFSDESLKQSNNQLPTPEATQLSPVKEVSDLSTSSVTGQVLTLEASQSISHEHRDHIAPQRAPSPVQEAVFGPIDDTSAKATTADTVGVKEGTTEATLENATLQQPQDTPIAQVVIDAHNTRSRTRQQNGSVEPVTREEAVEKVLPATPKRSHRRGKSTSSITDTPQSKALVTPKSSAKTPQVEPESARTDRSVSLVLDEQTAPKGHDASVDFAMSVLESPVKPTHDLRSKAPGGETKLKLNRVLRTELSEFTSLKVLRFHIAQKLDVLGVATTVPAEPERAKGGPRHYQIAFNITDQSIAAGGGSSPVTEVRVYRPYKDALPVLKVGDGVLLRNFEVISAKNRGFVLQSTDSSSWAVFTGDEDEVDVRGPPVEYGEGERKHITMLSSWYRQLEPSSMEKIIKANGK